MAKRSPQAEAALPSTGLAPADWYPDPSDAAQWRYWDGARWTEHRSPRGSHTSPRGLTPEVPAASRPVRTRVGVVAPLILLGAVAVIALLGPWALLLLLGAAAVQVWRYLANNDLALKAMECEVADPRRDAELIAMVHRLADRAGIDRPRVFVSMMPEPNAFASRTRSGSVVAVTAPVLEQLPADELEAVLGHEIGHLKNRDIFWSYTARAVASVVRVVVVAIGVVAGVLTALFGNAVADDDRNAEAFFHAVAAAITAWIASLGAFFAQMLTAGASRRRELLADQTGAELADPGALARALERLESMSVRAPAVTPALAAVSPMLFVNPFRDLWWNQLLSTHPSTATRVRKLEKQVRPEQVDSFRKQRQESARRLDYDRELAHWHDAVHALEATRNTVVALRPTTPTRDEQWLFALRQGEQVYFSAGGALVEVRRRQGQSVLRVTQEGDIALTTRGLVFHGSKRVRWDFPQISGVEWDVDPDHDSVLISTHTRVNPSGLLFGELPVDPRLAFQVAQAASRGQKQHLIASLDREIASLEAQRPLFAG